MKSYSFFVFSHIVCVLIALFAAPISQASDLVTYQGKLSNAAGDSLPDGEYRVGVGIWDSFTGGAAPLWARKYDVTVNQGIFALMIGAEGVVWPGANALTESLRLALSSGNRFLEITVMSDADGAEKAEGEWKALAPRQALNSVPFAMNGVPTGTVVPFAGATPPDGWVVCNGQELDSADPRFAPLFAVVSTTYGAGAGTQFKVPDMRGRTAIGSGKGDTWISGGQDQSTTWVAGQKFGAEQHQLTIAEMPSHNHDVNDPGHAHLTRGWDWDGSHSVGRPKRAIFGDADRDGQGSSDAATTGISLQPTGGNQPHSIIQPSLVLNYIIKL